MWRKWRFCLCISHLFIYFAIASCTLRLFSRAIMSVLWLISWPDGWNVTEVAGCPSSKGRRVKKTSMVWCCRSLCLVQAIDCHASKGRLRMLILWLFQSQRAGIAGVQQLTPFLYLNLFNAESWSWASKRDISTMINCYVKFHLDTKECEQGSECIPPITSESLMVIKRDQAIFLIEEYKKGHPVNNDYQPTNIVLYCDNKCVQSWRNYAEMICST